MRAVIVRNYGDPEVLEIAEVPVPEPGPGQVRIKVAAAGVNPVDVAVRAGFLAAAGMIGERDQIGIGWDAAGTVDAVGRGTAFEVGDRVVGLADRVDVPLAAQAEYLVLDQHAVARSELPQTEAATLPLNGLTAWQALDLVNLSPGSTLLVTGAAGAVGGFAVELGRLRGLHVVGVAGEQDEELVRGFGAEWFVPRSADLAPAVRELVPGGVDGVLDAAVIGARALDAVRSRGAYVGLRAGTAPPALRGTRVSELMVHAESGQLAELVSLAQQGKLSLRVAQTRPLGEVAQAQELLVKGGLRGRIVLLP